MAEEHSKIKEIRPAEAKTQPSAPVKSDPEKFWKITTVVLIVLLAFFAFRNTGVGTTTPTGQVVADVPTAAKATTLAPLAADDVVKGSAKAPVTVILYSDPSCPFCGAAAGENQQVIDYLRQRDPSWVAPVPKIIENYVNSGKVKLVFRYFPGHGTGENAMKVMLCANEQGKFWELHDEIFANQDKVEDLDQVKTMARGLGIDITKIDTCLSSKKYDQKIAKDIASGTAAGVQGTPDSFVNGQEVGGAQSFTAFDSAIKAALQ